MLNIHGRSFADRKKITKIKESTIKRGVASYISMLCSCSAICMFFLHRLNIADFASLNYWELNFFFKPAKHDVILMWYNFICEKYIGYKLKEMKIQSYENECMYNTSTTVYTQKQPSCVTLNYEAVTSLYSLLKCSIVHIQEAIEN